MLYFGRRCVLYFLEMFLSPGPVSPNSSEEIIHKNDNFSALPTRPPTREATGITNTGYTETQRPATFDNKGWKKTEPLEVQSRPASAVSNRPDSATPSRPASAISKQEITTSFLSAERQRSGSIAMGSIDNWRRIHLVCPEHWVPRTIYSGIISIIQINYQAWSFALQVKIIKLFSRFSVLTK